MRVRARGSRAIFSHTEMLATFWWTILFTAYLIIFHIPELLFIYTYETK